jgi:hypothetical protein
MFSYVINSLFSYDFQGLSVNYNISKIRLKINFCSFLSVCKYKNYHQLRNSKHSGILHRQTQKEKRKKNIKNFFEIRSNKPAFPKISEIIITAKKSIENQLKLTVLSPNFLRLRTFKI